MFEDGQVPATPETGGEPTGGGGFEAPQQGGTPAAQPQGGAPDGGQPQTVNQDANFAAMRRAMEEQARRQQENSPAHFIVQEMERRYGMTAEQIAQRLQEQARQQQAQQMGVAPELLQQMTSLQSEVQQLRHARMQERVERELTEFQNSYKDVTSEELDAALAFLGQAHRSGLEHMTLEQAFRATSPTWAQREQERIRQEILAQYANGNNPVITPNGQAPNTGGAKSAWDMSDDEFDALLAKVKSGERVDRL